MEKSLMTIDGLIERLQEIREGVGHDCNVRVCMPQGSRVVDAKIEMICADHKGGEDSAYIEIGYDELKWFER